WKGHDFVAARARRRHLRPLQFGPCRASRDPPPQGTSVAPDVNPSPPPGGRSMIPSAFEPYGLLLTELYHHAVSSDRALRAAFKPRRARTHLLDPIFPRPPTETQR